MEPLKWLVATRNEGKVRELRRILNAFPLEFVSLQELGITEESPETGNSFRENAMQKAQFYHSLSGLTVVADDSGLEVDALNGLPGIHSARFGGFPTHAEKVAYLLGLMNDIPDDYRNARFKCAAVFYDGKEFLYSEGTIEGFIGRMPTGTQGFGYDPIFHPEWDGPSMAEIPIEQKNQISHRGKAFFTLVRSVLHRQGVID